MPLIDLKKPKRIIVRITLGPNEATTGALRLLELLRVAGIVDLREVAGGEKKFTFAFRCPRMDDQKEWADAVSAHAKKYGLGAEIIQRS